MSKRQHQRQVERARAKRRTDRFEKRRRRARYTAIAAVVALGLSLFAAALISVMGSSAEPAADEAAQEPDTERCPPPDGAPEPEPREYDGPPEMTVDPESTYVATVETTCGQVLLELDPEGAPMATNSFVFLAEDGYFEGVPFHRVVPGFVIQGGDPTGTGTGGPGYSFEDELDTAEQLVDEHGAYPRGVLAMANSGPDTNGSQFFITVGDPTGLTPDYTVFGEVLEGMDVVDRIVDEPAESQMALDPVRIVGVEIDAD